jgi:hypothetical protein
MHAYFTGGQRRFNEPAGKSQCAPAAQIVRGIETVVSFQPFVSGRGVIGAAEGSS